MAIKPILRNAFVLAGFVTFIVIIFHFLSGNYIGDRIQGTWRAVCTREEITFAGNTFTRGRENGEFWMRGNLIFFGENENGYPIRVIADYIVMNGVFYLRSNR
jgi:hypothetical protein